LSVNRYDVQSAEKSFLRLLRGVRRTGPVPPRHAAQRHKTHHPGLAAMERKLCDLIISAFSALKKAQAQPTRQAPALTPA
jgi:hypothetical protein